MAQNCLSHEPSAQHARAVAYSTLVQTSLKIAGVRAAAQERVLEARVEAEEILASARVEADRIRQDANQDAAAIHERARIVARQSTHQITDRALDRRDALVFETVRRISATSAQLLDMAIHLIANSMHPATAEKQLASIMLEVTGLVPEFAEVAAQGVEDPAWKSDMDDRLAA